MHSLEPSGPVAIAWGMWGPENCAVLAMEHRSSCSPTPWIASSSDDGRLTPSSPVRAKPLSERFLSAANNYVPRSPRNPRQRRVRDLQAGTRYDRLQQRLHTYKLLHHMADTMDISMASYLVRDTRESSAGIYLPMRSLILIEGCHRVCVP